jgi:hypothetical protein
MSRVIVSGGALFLSVREGTGDEWRSNPSGSRRWFQLYSRGELSDLAMEAGFVVLGASVEPGVVSPGHWVNMHARSK